MRGADLYQGLGKPENSNPTTNSNGDSLINAINKYLSPIPESIQGLTPEGSEVTYEDINKFGSATSDFSRQDLETREAYRQGWGSEALNGLGRVVTNTPMTMLGNAASILDLEDYFNQDKEVGNWLTNAMEDYKAKVNKDYLPIYRKTGESLDLGDSAWWTENASSLIESIGGYAATGAALAAGVGALIAAAPVALGATAVTAITTGAVALGLNQAEGITTGIQVYKDTYDTSLKKGLNADAAKQKAADAAAYSLNINRVNIALNLTGASMFVRAPKLTRELVKNASKLNTIKKAGLEAGQEFLEEEINLVAEKAGKAYGRDEAFNLADGLDAIATKEGVEAGLLGALGGFGQTVATAGMNKLTGKTKDQQERFKAQQDTIKEIEAIGKANNVPDSASTFKTAYELGKLYKQVEAIDNVKTPSKELLAERKKLTDSILEVQAYNAFDSGTTDSLIQQYNNLKALSPEQAVAKGLHDNKIDISNPDHYVNKANKAIQTINSLEKVYLDSLKYRNAKDVYLNRAEDIALKENRNERQAILSTNRVKAETDILGKIQSGKINLTRGGNTVFYNLDNLDENPFTTPAEKQLYEEVKNKIKEIPSVQEFEKTKKEYDYIETEINKNDDEYANATSEAAQKKAKQDAEDALNVLRKAQEAAANKEAKAKADAERAVEQERIRKENLAKQQQAAEAKRQADAAAAAEAEAIRKANEAAKAAEEAAKGGVPPTPKPVVIPTPAAGPTLSDAHPFVVEGYIDDIIEDSKGKGKEYFIQSLSALNSAAESVLEEDALIEWNNYYNSVTSEPTPEAPEGGEPVSAEETALNKLREGYRNAIEEEYDIPVEQKTTKEEDVYDKLEAKIKAINNILRHAKLDMSTVTLSEVVNEVTKLFNNDIPYIKRTFNDLKTIVGTIQKMANNPEGALTPTYTLSDEGVVITGPEVPPGAPTIFSQEGSVDANNKLMARVRENDPTLTFVIQGKKITSIASVASKAIGDEGTEVSEELGVFKTVYDEAGKLIFNPNQDAIVDTTFITEGTTITLKIEESTGDLEEDIDNAAIAMYVNTPEGERKIGYVHLPSYAGIQTLAQSEVLPSVQEQLALIKQFRQQVLENKDSILTTTVSKRGFGNVNKKGKGANDIVPTLILSSAFANDPRVHLGVIGAIGENKKVYRQDQSIPLYGATEMEKGALVILLPHPSGTVVPYYAISNKLEADSRVNELVAETIKDFLSGKKNRKETTTILEKYVYTVPQGNIGATGIVVKDSDETGNRAVIINGQAVNPKSTTFQKTVGSVYFSANKNILIDPIKGKDYEIEIMNSNLVRTDVQANPVTYTNDQGEQVTENSYFHQVTTEFSTNLNKTAKPVTATTEGIDPRIAEIEERRKEDLNKFGSTSWGSGLKQPFLEKFGVEVNGWGTDTTGTFSGPNPNNDQFTVFDLRQIINAKYDAEIAALESSISDIEARRQETNNKNEEFVQQIDAIKEEEIIDSSNLSDKLIKNIPLPANTRITNWTLEVLTDKGWKSKNVRGKEEEFFGKENWNKIKEAKNQFDIEFKKIEDSNLAKINLIEQKQSDLLSTVDGLELRKAWSFGLIEEPNVVGLDETNFIHQGSETGTYYGYYYLSKPNKNGEWFEEIEGKTKKEVEDKLNAKYAEELAALESPVSDIEAKKADIEERREKSYETISFNYSTDDGYYGVYTNAKGETEIIESWDKEPVRSKLNAKYNAELEALKSQPSTPEQSIINKKEEQLANVKPVYHHTSATPETFNFGSFQRDKKSISQFGDGLNASSNTTSFLVKRYGKPIQGEVNDADFVKIDASKTVQEVYNELKAQGYKFKEAYNDEEDAVDVLAKQPGAAMQLFTDFQKSNPNVKGVQVFNHTLGNTKIAPFYVIYDSKSFYGPEELSKKIKKEADQELAKLAELSTEEEQARLQAIEDAKAFGFEIDDELEADIPTIFDTQNDISAEQLAAMKNNPSTLLIHPELNASTQNEAVLSIAYKALTIQPETEEVDGKEVITATNKELVKANFVEGARVLTNLAKTNPTNVAYAKAAKTMSIVAGDEVFEKLYAKASDFIKEIGFSTEESGFYNQMEAEEEVEEGEEKINQFIDEAASYEDRKTGASKRFKKFLAFIPAMEMIKGKPKTARNSLLLPTFNNYDSTFTMIANILSEYNYPSTADGLQLMINRLRAKDINNPVIIEVANKLEKAPQKIKVEFFNIFNQQHAKFKTLRLFWQKARTFKYFSQGQENKVKYAERLKPSLINSDRNKAQELVKEEMLTNFKQKGLILKSVISKLDRKTNNTTLEVNTAHNKAIYDQFLLALKDSGNYQADSAGKIKTEFLNETGFKTMYDLLSNTGVSISEKAFEDFLNNHLTQDGIRNQKAILGEVLGVIFKSLAGESKVGDVETEENIFQLNNPFYTESSSIGILARYEYNTRTDVFSSAFRHAGKSFYTFVRHTPLSELVLKLKNPWKANKKENAFIKGLIAMDPLARHSLWLNRMSNPTKTGDIAFTEAFNLYYEKGFRDSSEKGSTPKDLKDSIEKEHELNKVIDFQAQGNNTVVFHADTHSDKTTKALIQAVKHSINGYSGNIEEGIQLSDDTLNDLYSYFLGEYDRILQVNAQNEDPNFPENKKLKGYHASKGKPGLGSIFNIYYFLNSSVLKDTNPDLKTMLYDEQGNLQPISKENMAVVSNMIKEEINANFNNRFKKVKEDWGKLGLFFTETNKLGFSRLNVNSYMDAKYYNKVVEALGIQNKIVKNVTENFNQPAVDAEIQRILDYAIVDYAVNYAIATNEMLLITGDPAMHGKPSKDKGNIDSKSWVLKSIRDTFINVGKRNARLLASGNKGMFRKQKYNIGIIRDIQEVSEHVGDYIGWLKDFEPEYLKKKFTPEMTNAQELTTVEEHLEVMLAYGKITDNQFKTLLGLYDPAAYRDVFGEEAPAYTQKEVIENLKTVMQPMKPVQVQSVLDPEIKANVQYYIKTSSFPIIPALVKGKPMESVLKQMKAASISRVTFPSAVKLGEHGTKDLFIDGKVNEELFKDNVIELDRDGFSIQLEVPYKENKKEVREGTQNMKLLFMDLPDSLILELAEGNKTIEESKREYTRLHKEIIDSALTKLLEDIGATVTENEFGGKEYKMEDFSKLSEILKEEGESRGYSINSLLGLDLNEEGQFKIPLTFNPNSAQIEPVITALLSNRLVKLKMPGKSYVLGSEVLTLEENISRKGKQTQADINIIKDIIWLSEEHKTQRKLKYYREVKGKPAMAQIIMPAYFLDKEGKQIDMTKFVKNGFLDTSKIDKELLQIMGFRIPTQGHNSMMMFEVVGFLPKTSGDLVIVPAEIESQMGSDYDVDKLYTYHYNYSIDEKSGKLKKYNKPGSIKTKQNRLIEIQSAIIMNKEVAPYIMNPLSMDDLADAIEKLNANKKSEWEGNYSTIYQRTTYFDNAAGQIGVGISANANTNHAAFQQANVYIKGTGIMFLKEDGTPYSDIEDNAYEGNSVTKYKDNRYTYPDPFTGEVIDNKENNKSAWRLDKIFTFDGKRISDIISQWLGASVDNAKEKLLGEGGINKYNFNTSLLIARAGFGNNWIIPFINQPILKEYYDILQKLEDSTEKSFEAGKKEKAIEGLFKKYMDLYALSNPNETPEIQGVSLKQLERSLNTEINANNAETQLAVLKAFLFYETLSGEIGAVQKALNTDVKGLPKNITETAEKRDYITKHGYSSSYLGNVEKIREKVISGAFMEIPRIASQLFGTKKDGTFVYAYDSPAYKWAKQALAEITKREFNSEQINEIHNHIQQFIYTHPDFGLYGNDHAAEKQRLLFNENLADRLLLLQEKYPKNYFLSKISAVIDTNIDNPNKIKIVNTTAEQKIFIERMQQEWESAFYGEPELAKFAEDMAKYTMLFNSSQFGSSNLLKYLPFNYLNIIGAGKVLNGLELGDSMTLLNFVPQFLQHNPHYAPFAKEDNIAEKTAVYKKDADGKDTELIEAFSLPSLATEFDKNPAKNLIQTIEVDGESVFIYPKYVSMYGGAELGRILFVKSGEGNYKRVDTLGSTDFTEYNAKQNGLASTVIKEQKGIINVNAQTQTIDATSSDLEEVYFRNPTVHSLLESIIYRNSFSENPLNKAYGALAEKLLEQPENGYKVIVEESMVAAGSHNKTTKLLKFNKEFLLSVGELQLQRTILHEIVHKETVSKLSDPEFLKETKEGKAILKVYESFQTQIQNRALTDSEKTRSIPNELINAELFKILVDNTFGEVKRDLNITTLTKLNTADINSPAFKELMQLFSTNLSKIERFKASSKLEPGSERYEAVANYIKETFTPANINSLKTKYYAYSSILEFATEALTNKQTQEYLKTFTTINQKGEKVTLWEQFINALTSLLNFDNVNRTLAEDAVETIIDVIDYGKPAKVVTPPLVPIQTQVKTGVQELFNSNTELAAIGTPTQYSEYLDTIFPDSNIKDIVYHGTNSDVFENFDTTREKPKRDIVPSDGIFFSYDKEASSDNGFGASHWGKNIIASVVNIQNPEVGTMYNAFRGVKENKTSDSILGTTIGEESPSINNALKKWNTTAEEVKSEVLNKGQENSWVRTIVVFDQSQGHVLGNTQDIEGFKQFVIKNPLQTKEVILKYYGAYYKYNIDKDGNQVGASLYSQNGVDYISTSRDYASIVASNKYTNVTSVAVFGAPSEEGDVAKYELFPGVFANEGQKEALDKLDSFMASTGKEDEAFVLVGRGGTGKTTIIKKILRNVTNKKIGGATVSHAAKDVLGESIGKDKVYTLASLLGIKLNETTGTFEIDTYNRSKSGIPIQKLDLIIIDECSMVSDKLFEEIMRYKKPGAKIIFMGDNVQIPPVEQETDSITFKANKNPNNFAELTEPMRFSAENPIFALSYIIADNVEASESKVYAIPNTSRVTTLKEDTGVVFTNEESKALSMLVEDIRQEIEKETPNTKAVKAVTFNNEANNATQSVKNLNIKIREKLWGEDAKNQYNINEVLTAYSTFYEEKQPSFYNSETLIVKEVSEEKEVVYNIDAFDFKFKTVYLTLQKSNGAIIRNIPTVAKEDAERYQKEIQALKSDANRRISSLGFRLEEKLANLQYGYAITAHKAQGSTYTNVYVFEDNILGNSNLNSPKGKNKALYTAVTRASKKLVLVGKFNVNSEMNTLNDIDIFSTFDDELLDNQIKACE